MSTRRVVGRIGALSLGGILLAGLVAWRSGWLEPEPRSGARTAEPVEASSVTREKSEIASTWPQAHAPFWVEGRRLNYAADFGSKTTADPNVPDGWFAIRGSVNLALVVEAVTEDWVRMQGKLSGLSLLLENEEHAGRDIEPVAKDALERPFLMTVSRRGRLDILAVEPNVGGVGHAILRQLVSTLQFVWPDGSTANLKQWTAQETDQHGEFLARYQLESPGQYTKTKLEYSRLKVAQHLGQFDTKNKVRLESQTRLRIGRENQLEEAKNQEMLWLPIGEKGLQTDSHVTLVLRGSSLAERVTTLDASRLVVRPLYDAVAEGQRNQRSESQRRQRLIAGASLDTLFADLTVQRNPDARIDLMTRMEALFDEDPRAIGDAVRRLRGALPPNDAETLVGALAGAETPRAQSALLDLARTAAPTVQQAAATALGLHESPTQETIEGLRSVAENTKDPALRASATLALGGALRRQGEAQSGPTADASSMDYLARNYRTAESQTDKRLYLDALGNSGASETLEIAASALKTQDANLRSAAVRALRHVTDPKVDGIIAQTMTTDESLEVRLSAIATAKERGLTQEIENRAAESLRREPRSSVRKGLVELLGASPSLSEPTLAVLKAAAQTDASEEVREAAVRVLGG